MAKIGAKPKPQPKPQPKPSSGKPRDRDDLPGGGVKPSLGGTGLGSGGFGSTLMEGLAFGAGGLLVSDLFGGSALDSIGAGVGSAIGVVAQ